MLPKCVMNEHTHTLNSLMASVCRACEGSVVRGEDSPSLVKHSIWCFQRGDPEKESDKYGH